LEEIMDKDRVKGKVDEVAGRSKRQAGEWTGNTRAQAEGRIQELKGKVQNAWGKAKDAARDANESQKAPPEHSHSGRH
jgi:uncharacterized protein YjbJ (UPF0337 family)